MPQEFPMTGQRQIDVGLGFTLYPGGYVGSVTALERGDLRDGTTRSATARRVNTAAMQSAFERAGMEEIQTLQLSMRPVPGEQRTRSAAYGDAIVLAAPDIGTSKGLAAIVTDEDGGLTFHLPVESPSREETQSVTRGAGRQKVFVLRADSLPGEPDPDAERSLISAVGKKIIQVVAFPALKVGARAAARRFEEKFRPYGVRWFGAGEHGERFGAPIAETDWARLSEGRALLFVHGTFSTASGGFGRLPEDLMRTLDDRYGGRVFALNHPTLSESPVDNVRHFLGRLPSGTKLDLDVVSHSRGGLVARVLAGGHPDLPGDDRVRVRRILCAATPNHGTPLAESQHMKALLDRLGTMAGLIPGTPIAEVMDFVFGMLAALAEGVLEGLPGLDAMDPTSPFLAGLNRTPAPGVEFFGVSADYEPTERGLQRVIKGPMDAGVDFIFRGEPNDLVVPTRGVSGGNSGFSINRMLEFGPTVGAAHTSLWNQSGDITDSFAAWLPG